MNQNQFSIGDLVAHKHYPEQAMGEISKFHNSGRVGVRNNEGTRSFLPKNLILWGPPVPPVSDAIAKPAEGIANESENLDDDSDPAAPTSPSSPKPPTPPLPPAQVEELPDAISSSEVMEVPPAQVEELGDAIDTQSEAIAAQADLELLPIPRDFSELDELPQWWEKPILPEIFKCEEDDDDDGEEWWVLVEPGYFKAKYRLWELLIDDGYQIYATPPSGDRLYHCECELDIDGPSGQVAIAQDFIDSWYFAQPSPGQLSLNIPETVARDPPPRFG